MFSRSKKKKSSPVGQIVSALQKQAASPAGMSLLSAYAPRAIAVLTPIVISVCGFLGVFPGCSAQPSPTAALPEIRQTIRPGGKSEVVSDGTNRTNPFQLTVATKPATPTLPTPAGARDVVFAFWNCENFFDDIDDGRSGQGDRDYDPWYAKNPPILRLKLEKMTEAILSINNGKGPDILAMCEVESIRAAQLLQAALNSRLDPSLHYRNLVMKEMNSGRHIAPAVLTRIPVDSSRSRVLGSRQRTILCQLKNGDKDLFVIVSHWTSRLQDGERQRIDYAETIYGACNAIFLSNPKADFLVCGDFNDNPTDVSVVKSLHSTADPSVAMASSGAVRLFNLFGRWNSKMEGSLFYQGWHQFDQILVSPGMLDAEGWSCDPASARVVNHLAKPGDNNRRPWRFGGEKDSGPRGYSDHFPVSVRLIAR